MHRPVHRRADADLNGAARVYEALLDRMIERRAVPESLAEAFRPGVDMRVEMNERQWPAARGQRAQQPERDGVVASKRDQMVERARLCLDRRQRAGDVAMRDGKIADIGDVLLARRRTGNRMVAVDQHAAGLADRRRPEASAGPVRGAEIEGDPGDANRRRGVIALDPEKARAGGISRGSAHAPNMGTVRPRPQPRSDPDLPSVGRKSEASSANCRLRRNALRFSALQRLFVE